MNSPPNLGTEFRQALLVTTADGRPVYRMVELGGGHIGILGGILWMMTQHKYGMRGVGPIILVIAIFYHPL